MGLWRSITDWARTIIGCATILVVTTVVGTMTIAGLLLFVDPNMLEGVGIKKLEAMKTEEEKKAEKKERLVEFIKKVKPTQQFSKSLGRPIGKILAVSNDTIDALNSELPADLVAQTPDEVDAIALIARSERVVGVIKQAVISITVIDPERGDTLHISGAILGTPINVRAIGANAPAAPESPRAFAIKYLTALPRKPAG